MPRRKTKIEKVAVLGLTYFREPGLLSGGICPMIHVRQARPSLGHLEDNQRL